MCNLWGGGRLGECNNNFDQKINSPPARDLYIYIIYRLGEWYLPMWFYFIITFLNHRNNRSPARRCILLCPSVLCDHFEKVYSIIS